MPSQTSLLTTTILFILLFSLPSSQSADIYEYRMLRDPASFNTEAAFWATPAGVSKTIFTCNSDKILRAKGLSSAPRLGLQLNNLPAHSTVYIAFTYYEFSIQQYTPIQTNLLVSTDPTLANVYQIETTINFQRINVCSTSEHVLKTRIYGILPRTSASMLYLQIGSTMPNTFITGLGIRDVVISLSIPISSLFYRIDQTSKAMEINYFYCLDSSGFETALQYKDGVNCFDCDSSCAACFSGTNTGCYECAPNYVYDGTGCVPCDPSCAKCSGAAPNQCITCPSGKTLNFLSECCDPSCETCSGGSPTQCTSCPPGKTLDNSQCVSCHPSCSTCSVGAPNQCTSCPAGRTLNLFSECCDPSCARCSGGVPTQCTDCPLGTTLNSLSQCLACYPTCLTCTGAGPNQCETCIGGGLLSLNHECVGTCPPGSFSNGVQCLACHPLCQTCSGASSTQCESCFGGNLLSPTHTCVTACPPGSFADGTQCLPCHPSCATCSGGAVDQCDSCYPGSTLDTMNSECISCDPSCLECSGGIPTQCTDCPPGTTLDGFSCVSCDPSCLECSGGNPTQCTHCHSGTLNSLAQCLTCYSTCLTCTGTGPNQCETCIPGRLLSLNHECVGTCPPGSFPSGIKCLACHSSCATCSGGASSQCSSCSGGNLLSLTHTCVSTCPPGSFPSGSQCVACHLSCATCSGGLPNQCDTCPPGKIRSPLSECCDPSCDTCSLGVPNLCTSCPPGKTLNNAHQCVPCHSSCATCSGPASNQCTSCPSGGTPNPFSECCDPSCETCSLGVPTLCTSCSAGKALNSARQCISCDSTCATCSGGLPNQCTSCSSGRTLSIDNRCIEVLVQETGSTSDSIVKNDGGFYDTLFTPPSEPGTVTFVTFVKFMKYVRQLQVKLPPRLDKMSASKGRPVLSLHVQPDFESTIYSWFTPRSLAVVLHKQAMHERFMANFGGDLLVIGIIIACGFLFILLKFLADKFNCPATAMVLDKFKTLTKWNLPLMLFGLSIDDIILFSATEFKTINFDSASARLSFAMCMIIVVVALTFLLSTILLARKAAKLKKEAEVTRNNSKYEAFTYNWRSFQLYFRGFNEKPFLNQLFFVLYISRAALPMLFATLLQSAPVAQAVLQMLISVVIVSYAFLLKPLRKKINHYQMVIIESLVLLLNICVLALVAMANSGPSDSPGCVFLGDTIIIGNVIINVITVVILVIKMVIVLKEIRAVYKVSKKQAAISCIHLLVPPLQQIGLGFEELLGDIPVPSQGKKESKGTVVVSKVSKISVVPLPKDYNFNNSKKTTVDDTMDQPSTERLGQSSLRLLIGSQAMNQSQIINQSQAFNQSQAMGDFNDLSVNDASMEISSTRRKKEKRTEPRVTDMKTQIPTTVLRGIVSKEDDEDSKKPYIVEKKVQEGYIGMRSKYESTDERRRRTTSQTDGYKETL